MVEAAADDAPAAKIAAAGSPVAATGVTTRISFLRIINVVPFA
jgi:hypothetical protein